ncbi:MAG: DUF5615 family PIN-like protein [Candidatus Nanohaloarchaea archaeon]
MDRIDLVIDEDVKKSIKVKLNSRGIKTERLKKSLTDRKVILEARERDAPILTRNQEDFIHLNEEISHSGILIDKFMNKRGSKKVAETVQQVLEENKEKIEDRVWFVSNFYP